MAGKLAKTILLVDDEAIIAMAEARMLEKHGYAVLTAYSGEQAIKTAVENPSLDLILMDIDLGSGMDGTQAAEIILENMEIPVLFLSSHTEPEMVDKTEKITSYGYVVKNTGETVLLASIRMAFKLHAAHGELRKREEELIKNEGKLNLIFENTPNAITITEMETGIVVEANKGIEWTGWTRDEIIGRNPLMLQSWVHTDEGEKIRNIIKTEGKLSNHRVDFHKKDGSVAHAMMNSMFIQMDGKQFLLSISNDVTRLVDSEAKLRRAKEEYEGANEELNATIEELKATNEELQATNAEMEETKQELESALAERRKAEVIITEEQDFSRVALDSLPGLFYLFDDTGKFLRWNKNFRDVSKYSDEELAGMSALDFFREPDRSLVAERIRRVFNTGESEAEANFYSKDSSCKPYYFYGKMFNFENKLCLIGMGIDITRRKEIEETLRQSEERFSDLVRLLPETVFETDLKGRITYVNQAAQDLFGYVREDLEWGISIHDIIVPQDHERILSNIQRIMHGEHLGLNEYIARKKDGATFPALAHSSMIIRKGQPSGLRGFLVNISERKETEEKLRESEERWQFALEGAGDGVWDWNAETDRVYFSHQWKTMLGYEDHEIGDSLSEWDSRLHPDDSDRVNAELNMHFEGITPFYTSEHRLKCKNGKYKWILDRGKIISRTPEGKPLRVIGTHTDITYRKLVEELYTTFLQAALDGFVIFDTAGRILEANDAFSQMTGYSHNELINMSIPDFEANFNPEEVARRIKKMLSKGSERFETRHRRKDGRIIDVEISVKVLEYEGDRLFVIMRDITDQKLAGAALENSLREKEALLRELQHRMKNSLAMIAGIINLELERITDRNLRDVLDNIKGRIGSLSNLYALLFQSDTVREVDLGMYMQSIVELLSDSYAAGRSITIKQSYDPLRVNTKNATAWGLIANELLTNSFKYAFPEGRSGDINISLKKTDREIILTVSDNGAGLSDDFNIENPSGLGLLLVKTLTLQLKGTLEFERGGESVFSIRVPFSSEA